MADTKKIFINLPLVQKLIAEQFPHWADQPITPVENGGWDNKTFHLGKEMSVRLPSAECYADQVSKEQLWLPKLAPHLPCKIPEPVAVGQPSKDYPWNWSIYRWIDGATASYEKIDDLNRFASELAQFLSALHRIDITEEAPVPGDHNFYRGGSLATYDAQTQHAIANLGYEIDVKAIKAIWKAALETTWQKPPVWVHGDIAIGNLLVDQGKLAAVIDFGCCSVGDPACDLVIAWTFFHGESRQLFRKTVDLDPVTWSRARGWALWKALCAAFPGSDEIDWRVVKELLKDYNNETTL